MNAFKILFLLFFLASTIIYSQVDPAQPSKIDDRLIKEEVKSIWIKNEYAEIYPVPVNVTYHDEYYDLYTNELQPKAFFLVEDKKNQRAAVVFNNQLLKFDYPGLPIFYIMPEDVSDYNIIIKLQGIADDLRSFGEQAYQIKFADKELLEIELSGGGERGLIYASVSLSQLVCEMNNSIKIRKVEVFDYPAFSNRIFNSDPLPYHLAEDLDWMLRYKIESIALHNKDFSWYEPDEVLQENLIIYNKWKENFVGVNALLILNLYAGKYGIEVTNNEHLEKLKRFLQLCYEHGVTRFMLNADDSPPFKFSEGYYLTSEKDKDKFTTLAEAHCWLMNNIYDWAKQNKYEMNLLYCPSFYTYEEMHYGDMQLFKGTPWEDAAFGPLRRDLKIIGEKMYPDIEIMWTGPYVCTRTLTDEDLDEWTNNLQGRKPFLFDNSIFSDLEFTARTMFTPYGNEFPRNFSQKTGGNGIFINGNAVGESSRAATMTANAYMWEESNYNKEESIIKAMQKLYHSSNINLFLKYKEVELELTKTVRQRELWFASDELWQSIRNTRFITEKNPFYYHQNYGRLKALRLQIKHSVPEPDDYDEFKNKCIELDKQRRDLLDEIEKRGFIKLSYSLQSEMIPLPNFNKD